LPRATKSTRRRPRKRPAIASRCGTSAAMVRRTASGCSAISSAIRVPMNLPSILPGTLDTPRVGCHGSTGPDQTVPVMASSVERQNTLATRTPRENRVITDGPRPKHAQLSDVLADLAAHRLGPDAAIPSERELMTTYDVSRATVRKAIDSLVDDGLLHRIHGKGTCVARPRLESRLHLASFSQDMRRRGLTPSTRLLSIDQDRPPTDVAKALDLGADGVAWRIDRVRLAD